MPVSSPSLSPPNKTFVQGVSSLHHRAGAKKSKAVETWRQGPGNRDNENESTSVIVSVQQSGRPLVPTDNPLCVGLVSNDTTTMTQESSRA